MSVSRIFWPILMVAISAVAQDPAYDIEGEISVSNTPEEVEEAASEIPTSYVEGADPIEAEVVDNSLFEEKTSLEEVKPDPQMDAILKEYDKGGEISRIQDSSDQGEVRGVFSEYGKDMFNEILKGIMALCCVLAIILFLYAALKKFGKHAPILAGSSLAKIMGKIHLDRGVSLHFIRVAGKVLVVGVTSDHVSLVAEFDKNEFEWATDIENDEELHTEQMQPDRFLKELKLSREVIEDSNIVEDDEITSLKGDIQRLQQYLRENAGDMEG